MHSTTQQYGVYRHYVRPRTFLESVQLNPIKNYMGYEVCKRLGHLGIKMEAFNNAQTPMFECELGELSEDSELSICAFMT